MSNSILLEANRLVTGSRRDQYGHPLEDFTRVAKIWSAILGVDITPQQACLCMQGIKISREVNSPKKDNRVDGARYWQVLEMIEEKLSDLPP